MNYCWIGTCFCIDAESYSPELEIDSRACQGISVDSNDTFLCHREHRHCAQEHTYFILTQAHFAPQTWTDDFKYGTLDLYTPRR